ncbi:MAG: isoprenylcysteine carboxylmethyltransferase family protein [Balneolaceae bacterium]
MKFLELKVPPVIVFLICLSLIWGANQWVFIEGLSFGAENWIVQIFVAIAVLIGLLGIIEFRRKSTTVNPHKPGNATTLVTTGIYTFSRNPMYTALLIVLIAGALKWGSLVGFLVLPLFIIYMNRFQIKPEETVLEEKFGEEFIFYKEDVRRWA